MRTTIPTFLLVAGLALTSFPSFAKDSPAERAPAAQAQRDLLAEPRR
jgi:hypothetical protein